MVLWALAPVLTPFLVAAVFAYMLAPLVHGLRQRVLKRMPRVVVVVVVELLFVIALLGVMFLMVPILVSESMAIRDQLPALAERVNTALTPWLAKFGLNLTLDVVAIKAFVLKYFHANTEDLLAAALASVKLGGSVALALVGNLVLIPVVLFYLLLDWERLVPMTLSWVPIRWRPAVDRFLEESDGVLGQYLRGQLMVMLVLSMFYSAMLLSFGLELALPIGVFTGLAIFVPYVGFGVGLLLAAVAGLLQFSLAKAALMLAVVYGLGQLLESLVLTPRLVGERIGLHPLAVIFALLAFGQLLGFVGVLIALPASAVLLVAIRRLRAGYLASRLYQG
jgi:predicted PurR-regulated permease PerM